MPSEIVNQKTRLEWRDLGFYYDRDDSAQEWRLTGSRNGLLRFRDLLLTYANDPRHAGKSEHEHYGPYVTGVGSWDGTQLLLVPDGRQSPLSIPLSDGRVPAHELTTDVWAALLRLDAENAETVRAALDVADFLAFWSVASLPAWAASVPEPLAVAWVPGWPTW